MLCLGIDGARKGGAMLLLGPTGAVAAVSWREVSRDSRKVLLARVADRTGVRARAEHRDAWDLSRWCHRQLSPYTTGHSLRVGIEDVFVGKNPRVPSELAKVDTALVAPWVLASLRCDGPHWVTQGTWRKVSFPRRWTKRYAQPGDKGWGAAAKRCSLDVMPALVPGLDHILAVLGRTDHLCDASGVARCVQRAM